MGVASVIRTLFGLIVLMAMTMMLFVFVVAFMLIAPLAFIGPPRIRSFVYSVWNHIESFVDRILEYTDKVLEL